MSNPQLDASKNVELSDLRQEREAFAPFIEEQGQEIIEVEHAATHNTYVPLLALPMEVTCIIFQFAVEYPMRYGEESTRPEVVVSHVCNRWRSISLSFPRLWATLFFDGRHHDKVSYSHVNRLDAYLERSSFQALELWFDFRGTVPEYMDLFERTLPHIERWKRVTILISSDEEDSPPPTLLARIRTVVAPNLEHFAFSCDLLGSPADLGIEPTIFANGAPKLQSAILDWSGVLCIPPLSSITTLRLETLDLRAVPNISWATFISVLTLPSLANLSLAGDVFEYPTLSPPSTIPMSNLIHLRCFTYGVSFWLPYLRAPLLETLIIKNDRFRSDFVTSVEPYVFPSLRSVSLINVDTWSPDVAWHFARVTASATDILFSQRNCDETLFFSLQDSEEFSKRAYWSEAKLLICDVRTKNDACLNIFLRFAKSRPEKNDFVLRIYDHLDVYWRQAHPSEYDALAELCTIDTMDDSNGPLVQDWPPGEYHPMYMLPADDPFHSIFSTSMR